MKKEYNKLAKYYDLLHNGKDYKKECDYFSKTILRNKKSKNNMLLDLACGTWEHIKYLKKFFNCEWLDTSREFIKMAKIKNPRTKFYIEDMSSFRLNKKYDVITILFNSIIYLNKKQLNNTIKNAYQHLNKGWILFIETIFLKNKLNDVVKHTREYKDKNLDITREINIKIFGNYAILNAKYKINSDKFIENDKRKTILLGEEELKDIYLDKGFKVKIKEYKSTGTTLFIGIK